MTCASCVGRVEKALLKVPGVLKASVNLATESARVRFAPRAQMDARLRRAVRDAGYEPRAADALAQEADESPWAGFAPVAVGLALSLPLVLLLHGVYGSHWAWAFKGGAHRTAQRLIDAGAIPPLVLAMPSAAAVSAIVRASSRSLAANSTHWLIRRASCWRCTRRRSMPSMPIW